MLSGRTAIITGAGGGIGRSIAHRFAKAGANLILNDVCETTLKETAGHLKDAPGKIVLCAGDIGDTATIEQLMQCVTTIGSLHILINNAGLTQTYKPFLDTTIEDWDSIFRVNLKAAYLTSLAACQFWVRLEQPGAVVNITSPGAIRSHLHNSIYDATKGGMNALTRSMAVDLGRYGIRVNAIAPAAVSEQPKPQSDLPLGRGATGSDVAEAALFLASDAAGATTGHVLAVDGGLLAQLRSPCND